MDQLTDLLDRQDGTVSRRQALASGLTPTDVARRVRRREWTAIHAGVYVVHTGPPSWRQRAWAAVLACWPAALTGRSALRAHEGPGRRGYDERGAVEIAITHARRVRAPAGVRVSRVRRFDQVVQWNLGPPRIRYDDALLAVADAADGDLAAIAVLADACGGRRTTAARLITRLEDTARLHRRAWLRSVLEDVATGTCSVLEHGYLRRVERAHGLPVGLRQTPAIDGAGRRVFRDVHYGGDQPHWTQVVELDGRLFHASVAERDRDLDRDLATAVDRSSTLRLGYGQVFDRGCHTAERLALLLRQRGWTGSGHPCPQCPADVRDDWGRSGEPG